MSSTTFEIVPFSESTDGHPITITATTSGTAHLLHTCTSTTDQYDEIYVWAVHGGATEAVLYIQADDGASAKLVGRYNMKPGVGQVLMVDGVRFSDGMRIEAYASANVGLLAFGNVNRGTNQ